MPRVPCDTTASCPARRLLKGRTESPGLPLPAQPLCQHQAAPCISLQHCTIQMDKDKRNPNSQSPSPWPSRLQDQPLSKQCQSAVGASHRTLSETEEGDFLHMDKDCKSDTVQDFCQCRDVNTSQEPETEYVTFKDATFQKLGKWQKAVRVQVHPHQGARRNQELYELEDVRGQQVSQWCDGRHQEVYQWQENGRGQELSPLEQLVTVEELAPWQEQNNQEQSQGQVGSNQTLPDCEDSREQHQSHGQGRSSTQLPDHKYTSQEEEAQGKCSTSQEALSSWEDSTPQNFSQGDYTNAEEFSDSEGSRASGPSCWEDDSNPGLQLHDWEHGTLHSFWLRPLCPEEDEWEELSVLELPQAEGRAQRLSVPDPRRAWPEHRLPELSMQVPLCAFPLQLEVQSPRWAEASPAWHKQEAEAGTRRQLPAPQSPSPSPSQMLGPKKRPSRVRRALRALRRLFRSCLLGQPQH